MAQPNDYSDLIGNDFASKWSPDIPKKWLDHCREGGSVPEFCLEQDICDKTFYNWCKAHPELAAVCHKGKKLAEGWWMREGRRHLVEHEKGTKLNTNLYKWITSGRFGHSAEKALHDKIDEIQKRLDAQENKSSSAYAETAECESIDSK